MKSPFKFLESYTDQDQDIFFGRDNEIEELFHRVFKSNLLLVYGASGTGKTSLVRCGLSTKFSKENWFSVYIRRQENINESLLTAIKNNTTQTFLAKDLDPDEPEIIQRIEGLYLENFKPIYLIFDQLEELYVLGKEAEQKQFYQNVKCLIDSKLNCTIILIIREEYIAYLSDFEDQIPSLFENRIRIEKMRTREVKEVVEKTCDTCQDIQIDNKEIFLNDLVDTLSEDQLTVELTYLQVYLDKLYRNSEVKDGVHIFSPLLIEKTGKVQDVLSEFLEEQVNHLNKPSLGWKILVAFISKDGTKKSTSVNDIFQSLRDKNYEYEEKEVENYIYQFVSFKILTALEQTPDKYEFTHDSLAAKTYERLDAKEKSLIEISSFISQSYIAFNARGVLMSKEDLSYVTPFLEDLGLKEEHVLFLKKSKKKVAKRRKRRLASLISIVITLTFLSIFSFIQLLQAKSAEEEAKNAVDEAKIEAERADSLKTFAEKNQVEAERQTIEAQKQKNIAETSAKNLESEKTKALLALNEAESANLITQSKEIRIQDPTKALKLALEAVDLHPSFYAYQALMNAYFMPIQKTTQPLPSPASALKFNPYNNSYIIGLENGNLIFSDSELENQKTSYGHKGLITTIAQSNDTIYTGSKDRTVKIWSKEGGFIKNYHEIFAVPIKIFPTGSSVVIAYDNGIIESYDKSLGEVSLRIEEPGLLSISDALMLNSNKIFVIDLNGKGWIFDIQGNLLDKVKTKYFKSLATNGKHLAYVTEKGELEYLKITEDELNFEKSVRVSNNQKDIGSLDFYGDNLIIGYLNNGHIRFYDIQSQKTYEFRNSDEFNNKGFQFKAKDLPEDIFITSSGDSLKVYDIQHFSLPAFPDTGSTSNGYTLGVREEQYILQTGVEDAQLGVFSRSAIKKISQPLVTDTIERKDVPNTHFSPDWVLDISPNETSFGSILKNRITLNSEEKCLFDFGTIDEKIHAYVKSQENNFILVFTEKNVRLYPLPKYVYEESKKLLE